MGKSRYNLDLSKELKTKLKYLANSKHVSMAEIMRRALGLYIYWEQETSIKRQQASCC